VARIEDLLQRRTDLSTFLVHFTRTSDDQSAREHLLNILIEGQLRCGHVLGMAADAADQFKDRQPQFFESQRVVCFTETPLEHAWMMCEHIETRQIDFSPYGLAFTKAWGRSKGINPVWYLDISARGIEWLTEPVNRIVAEAIAAGRFDHDIFKVTPFLEQMGPTELAHKEFWWEREWRVARRDIWFEPSDTVVVLVPADDHAAFLRDLDTLRQARTVRQGYFDVLSLIDPRWGLERIIAKLADVPDRDAGPFPP
jgi:hypothetical protein